MKVAIVLLCASLSYAAKPLMVFVLAGQSNMEGHGPLLKNYITGNNGVNSLQYMATNTASKDSFGYLLEDPVKIKWKKLSDVFIAYKRADSTRFKYGELTAGYGVEDWAMGIELGFGYVMGDYLDNPVLLIKTAWGGKSLVTDFRPPSSGGNVGPYYTLMIQQVSDVLKHIKTYVPGYEGDSQGYQLAGFVWHQGWNDMYNDSAEAEYAQNLVHIVKDLRKEWQVPKLPMLIVEQGQCGPKAQCDSKTYEWGVMNMRGYQKTAVAAFPDSTVKLVLVHDFYYSYALSPSSTYYHWNNNSKSYYQIGLASAEAMKTFLPASDLTDSGIITSQYSDSPLGSAKEKAFDNDSYATKYVVPHASAWIQYQFGKNKSYAVNRYTIASANTLPEADPKTWTLMGSNDGTTWFKVDSQSNVTFQNRWEKKEFTVANTSGYSSYKINMSNHSGTTLQLGEIQLFGGEQTVPITSTNRQYGTKGTKEKSYQVIMATDGKVSIKLNSACPPYYFGRRESKWGLRFNEYNAYTLLGQKATSEKTR